MSSYELDKLKPLLPPESAIKFTSASSVDGIVASEVHYHDAVFDVRPDNADWEMTPHQINALAAGSLGLHLELSGEALNIKNITSHRRQLVRRAGLGHEVAFNGTRFSAAVDYYIKSDVLDLREAVPLKTELPAYIVEAIKVFGNPVRLAKIAAQNGMDRFALTEELNEWAAPNSHVLFGYAVGALATKSS